ncbi:MAG TPA: deoxyribonuclease IV [Verrucomicrobiae bacterium]|nr:deoxyribonuclease IV [Verrucomicrobiae bacterium]
MAIRVGAHVSTAGGLLTAFDRARAIGAEAVQVHPTAPQTWRRLPLDDDTVGRFHQRMGETGLDLFFFHAVYLINLGTPRPDLLAQSTGSLRHYLELASRLGVRGVIVHPGSHRGQGFDAVLSQIAEAIREALTGAGDATCLLLENSAGAGDNIGSTFRQIGRIVDAVGDPRVGMCLDTAHTLTAGYDIATADGLATALDELQREVGLERLLAVHANDSKAALGSNVDRHENIGDGHLGDDGLRRICREPRLDGLPFILEVPGLERQGPDRANVERLRALAGLPPQAAVPTPAVGP